ASVSAIAGTSGNAAMRLGAATPKSLSCPPFTSASETPRLSNMRSTLPAARSVSTGAEPRIEILVDDERGRRRREQRVAIRVGLGDRLGADIAGGADAVLDHHRLSPLLRQPVGEDARHHVGGAAGGKRHDDLDRPRREGVCQATTKACTVKGE